MSMEVKKGGGKSAPSNHQIDNIIDDIVNVLGTKYGRKVKSNPQAVVSRFISTGNPLVDWVLGKGLPVGKIIEIWGEEGTGKSTLAYQILAEVYRRGGVPVLFDTERSFDINRAKVFGLEKLICENPETVEEAFDMLNLTMQRLHSAPFGVVVWDSLAATPTKADLNGNAGIGSKARVVSDKLQQAISALERSSLSLIIINQARSKIDSYSGFGRTNLAPPSARALRHEAVIRAQLRITGKIKVDNVVVGNIVTFFTEKNKIDSPYKAVDLHLFYKVGFSAKYSIVENAIQFGIIQTHGSWLAWKDKKFQRSKMFQVLSDEDINMILDELLYTLEERYDRIWKKLGF